MGYTLLEIAQCSRLEMQNILSDQEGVTLCISKQSYYIKWVTTSWTYSISLYNNEFAQ